MDPVLKQKLQRLVEHLAHLDSDLTPRVQELRESDNSAISQTQARLAACIAMAKMDGGEENEDIGKALISSIGVLAASAEQLIVHEHKKPGLVGLALLRAAKTLLGSLQVSSKGLVLTPKSERRYLETAMEFLGAVREERVELEVLQDTLVNQDNPDCQVYSLAWQEAAAVVGVVSLVNLAADLRQNWKVIQRIYRSVQLSTSNKELRIRVDLEEPGAKQEQASTIRPQAVEVEGAEASAAMQPAD